MPPLLQSRTVFGRSFLVMTTNHYDIPDSSFERRLSNPPSFFRVTSTLICAWSCVSWWWFCPHGNGGRATLTTIIYSRVGEGLIASGGEGNKTTNASVASVTPSFDDDSASTLFNVTTVGCGLATYVLCTSVEFVVRRDADRASKVIRCCLLIALRASSVAALVFAGRSFPMTTVAFRRAADYASAFLSGHFTVARAWGMDMFLLFSTGFCLQFALRLLLSPTFGLIYYACEGACVLVAVASLSASCFEALRNRRRRAETDDERAASLRESVVRLKRQNCRLQFYSKVCCLVTCCVFVGCFSATVSGETAFVTIELRNGATVFWLVGVVVGLTHYQVSVWKIRAGVDLSHDQRSKRFYASYAWYGIFYLVTVAVDDRTLRSIYVVAVLIDLGYRFAVGPMTRDNPFSE